VWYSWTAPDTNPVTFNLYHLNSPSFTNTLGVYTGSTLATLVSQGADSYETSVESVTVTPSSGGDVFQVRVASDAGSEGTFQLEWGDACSAPGNDNFASATVLGTGSSGSSTAQNTNKATLETDELGIFGDTSDATSVWYSWTPASSGPIDFRVDLTSLNDSTLGVYTGTSAASTDLTEITTNDDYNGFASQVHFDAVASTTYMIRVAGYSGDMGQFDLVWGDFTPPDVTVSLHTGQVTPTTSTTAHFDVAFTAPVTGFDASDIDTSGSTAGTTNIVVTDTGDQMNYTVDVDATSDGDVTISIPADSALSSSNIGNTASNSETVTVDTTAPVFDSVTTKVQGPKVTVTFSATDLTTTTYECKIDSGSYASCSSPYSTQLAKGNHSVTIRATDAVGHQTESTPVNFTIKSGKIKV
jgi:hypothetical protein